MYMYTYVYIGTYRMHITGMCVYVGMCSHFLACVIVNTFATSYS